MSPEERLEAAFRKLRIKVAYPGKIPFATTLPTVCRELVRMSAIPPRGDPRRELTKLKKHAEKLANVITNLHQPARDAAVVPDGLMMRLAVMIGRIDAAELGTKPRKREAEQVTKLTAETYYRLTGAHAHVNTKKEAHSSSETETYKAYGSFLNLLTEVFDILGIEASAESQARGLAKEETHT